MDILAGIFAYLAGLGAIFAAVAMSFVFFVAPNRTIEAQSPPPSATAMLVRPAAPAKAAPVATSSNAVAGNGAGHPEKRAPEKQVAAAPTPDAARSTQLGHHKGSAAAARLRRLVQEERARRWAYQQDSSFESRFLGYAD